MSYKREVEAGENSRISYYLSKLPQTENTLKRINTLSLADYNSRYYIDNTITFADLEFLKKLPHIRPKDKEAMKAGRNDPCPCGSGEKFKKCCLGKE